MKKLVLCLSLTLLLCFSSYGVQEPEFGRAINLNHPLADGLVGLWILNEGIGNIANDLSPNSNTGTLYGFLHPAGPNSGWHPSPWGQHLRFDGWQDYVLTSDIPQVNTHQFLTVCVRFRTDILNNYNVILHKGYQNESERWGFMIGGGALGGTDDMIIVMANGANAYGYTTDNWLVAGVWYHAAMVFDGTGGINSQRLKFYIDGVQKTLIYSAGGIPTTTSSNTQGVRFGFYMDSGFGTYYWEGSIKDIWIYDRVLRPREIREIYHDPYQIFLDDDIASTWAAIQAGVSGGQVIMIQ